MAQIPGCNMLCPVIILLSWSYELIMCKTAIAGGQSVPELSLQQAGLMWNMFIWKEVLFVKLFVIDIDLKVLKAFQLRTGWFAAGFKESV